MKAIKWYHHYGTLHGEVFDSVDEAARSALHASDAGTEALVCIETEEGERITWDHPTFVKVEREIEQMWAAMSPDPATLTHYVEAKSVDGKWALISPVQPEAQAWADRDAVASIIGADRVEVRHRDQKNRLG